MENEEYNVEDEISLSDEKDDKKKFDFSKWYAKDSTKRTINLLTAFLVATVINLIVKGFSGDLQPDVFIDPSTYIMGLATGVGTLLVQRSSIKASSGDTEDNNKEWVETSNKIKEKQNKIESITFADYFLDKLNQEEIEVIKKRLKRRKISEIELKLSKLNREEETKKNNNKISKLKKEKEYIKINGVDLDDYEPYGIDDLFSFNTSNKENYGKKRVDTDSEKKHFKKSFWSKFYMPLFTSAGAGLLAQGFNQSAKDVAIYTGSYFIILIWLSFKTYTDQKDIKLKDSLPKLKTKLKILNTAEKEYQEWLKKKEEPKVEEVASHE